MRAGSTDVDVRADNRDLSFGGRLSYYRQKEQSIRELVDKQGLHLRFQGLATGQSLGVLGAPGITYNCSETHTNDGTGKSLSGGQVIAKTCGNQAGFGMVEGFIATRGVGSRGAVRKSGGVFVTEYAGPFFANFHTRGRTYVLGKPEHYSQLTVGEGYRAPFAYKAHALGFGFLSGFSGGVVYMPTLLWEEALTLQHVSPTIRNQITPQPLNEKDVAHLIQDLEHATQQLDSVLQKAILAEIKQNPQSARKWFVKLTPPKPKAPDHAAVPGSITLAEEKLPLPEMRVRTPGKIAKATNEHNPNMVIPPDRDRAACGTGLILDLDGKLSHDTVRRATTALQRLEHRGASGTDPLAGDGCGVLLAFGHTFFAEQPELLSLNLQKDRFGVMSIFMPSDLLI